MEIFNKLKSKVILITIMVIVGTFALSKPVEAKSILKTVGGKLLEPISELMVFVGDVVLDALQTNFLTEQRAVVQANSSDQREGISGWTIVKYIGGALAIVGGVAITIASFGTLTAAGVASVAGGVALVGAGAASVVWGVDDTVEGLSGEFDLPMIAYTPFAIFSNSIPIFDINFFSPNTDEEGSIDFGEGEVQVEYASKSSANILQPTVASWYVALRNIAFVGLLSILLYVGIRIIITASNNEKAKYKQMILDWLVAMCLLFGMHYIMVFTVTLSEKLSEVLAGTCEETILVPLPDDTKIDGEQLEADPETGHPIWTCSFTGYARLIAGGFVKYDTMKAVEFTIIYVVLVIYTVIFTIMYLKRVLYMAFLTIIAPLVAMTYPLDKLHDGKAQGFDTWFKEYVFNALLQPFHLLIYSIVIGTVMNLAVEYPIYALVALGFLMPAEKMLRRMFGFEKAQTPGAMGAMGAAGAGLIMSGINKLTHKPRRMDNGDNKSGKENDKIRMKDDKVDALDKYADENAGLGDGGLLGLGAAALGATGIGGNKKETKDKPDSDTTYQSSAYGRDLNRKSMEDVSEYLGKHSSRIPQSTINANSMSANQIVRPKRKMRNKIAGGINAVGARYSRKIKNSHPLKALRRGAAYGFGAASLGMVGLAAGIASGDPGKAFQYATGAAYVGGNLAKNTSDSLADEGNGTVQDWKEGWYGAEYDEHMQEKEIKQMQADYDNIAYLKDREPDEYKDILKHVYPAYARSGCADIKDFYAAYQLEESGLSRDSAISTYKLAQRVGDVSSSPDAESKWQKRLQEEFNNTSAVRIRQQNIAEQYRKEMERLQQEYEQNYKKVEATRAGDIREKLAVLQEQRKKQVEAMQRQQQEEQQQVSATLAQSAMKNIKQFYKNK